MPERPAKTSSALPRVSVTQPHAPRARPPPRRTPPPPTARRAPDRMAAASHALAARSRSRAVVSRIVIFGAAATVAAGLLIRHLHGGLGTATPPFVMVWGPRLDPLAAVSALAAAVAIAYAPRLPHALRRPPAFAAGAFALALALGLALNLARTGIGGGGGVLRLPPGGPVWGGHEVPPRP